MPRSGARARRRSRPPRARRACARYVRAQRRGPDVKHHSTGLGHVRLPRPSRRGVRRGGANAARKPQTRARFISNDTDVRVFEKVSVGTADFFPNSTPARACAASSSSAGGRVDEKKKSVRRVAAGRLFFKKPFIISNLPDRETPSPLPRAPFPRPPSRLRPRSRAFFGPYPPREARRLRLFVARREGAPRRAPRAPPAPSPRRPRTAVSPPPSSYRTRRPRLLVPRAPPRRVRRARTNDMCLSPPSRASASSRPPFLSRGWGTRRRRRSWR